MKDIEKNDYIREYYRGLSENPGCGPQLIFFCLIILCLFFSCCPCRKAVDNHTSTTIEKDSTHTEHKTETKIIYIHDTTLYTPPQQEKEKTTADSTSHLETDLAESDAKIMPDGSLYHSLKNKREDIPVEFDRPETTIHDTLYVYESHEKEDVSEDKETVEVERDYTWWDKTRFYVFYILLGFMIIKYCRKPIWNGIKKLIKTLF